MKIDWHQNPLKTTVELSDAEKEIFRLKVTLAEFEEAVGMAALYLDEKDNSRFFDPAKALQNLGYVQDDDVGDREFQLLLHELEHGTHFGDCTCFAMSCAKCRAEDIVGINTIEGLGKHQAHKISSAFGADGTHGIDAAIAKLADYEPVRDGQWLNLPIEQFEAHVPRWRAEGKRAYEWLIVYRSAHFGNLV